MDEREQLRLLCSRLLKAPPGDSGTACNAIREVWAAIHRIADAEHLEDVPAFPAWATARPDPFADSDWLNLDMFRDSLSLARKWLDSLSGLVEAHTLYGESRRFPTRGKFRHFLDTHPEIPRQTVGGRLYVCQRTIDKILGGAATVDDFDLLGDPKSQERIRSVVEGVERRKSVEQQRKKSKMAPRRKEFDG